MNLGLLLSEAGPSLSVPAMFLLGVMASPHCGLMCGALSVQQARLPGSLDSREILLWTQAGRAGGYAAAGSIAGAFGQSFVLALPAPWLGECVRALGALLVLILGMRMLLNAPQPALAHCHIPVPPGSTHWPAQARLLIQGSAWALIPCGLLYSVLLMSAFSASATSGALLASAFALGGSPALALIGWSGSRRPAGRNRRRFAGIGLVALGSVSLGLVLLGGHGGLPAWCALNR